MAEEKQPIPEEKPKEEKTPEEISPEAEAVAANQPPAAGEPGAEKPEEEKPTEEAPAPPEEEKPEEKPPSAEAPEGKPAEAVKPPEKPEAPPPPKKIGKEPKKRKSNVRFLAIVGLSFVGLFVLFVVLMVLMIAVGGAESPVLTAFGLEPAEIKSFLLGVINISFGFLSLLFFVIMVVGVFKLLFAKKDDKEAKRRGIKMTLIGVLPLIFVMFIWLLLFNYISKIKIAAEIVKAEITVLEPTVLEDLQAPLEVTFSSENVIKSLQNKGLQITGVRWDFDGDGVFETTPTDFAMSYLYNLRGTYNIGLEVDIEGEEEARRYFYTLSIGEAVFGAKPSTGTAPLEVQFDASNLIPKDKKIQSLDWDFDGDGEYDLTGKDNLRPRYTFEQIGVFHVHLRIVDVNNVVENYFRDIEIVISERPLLSAEIEASPGLSGQIPLQIRFDGGKSESVKGQIVGYEWDFGDGSDLQVGRTVSHIYNEPGFYTVTLTIEEDTGKEASTTVEVEAKSITVVPEAVIITEPPLGPEGTLSGTIPFKVSFDASQSIDPDEDIVDYEWDIDGAMEVGQKVEFTFETVGTYTVTLLVRDAEDQEGTASITVEVEEPGVRAEIHADPEEGTAPLTVNFDGSASSTFRGNIVSYEWDFGDGSPPSVVGAKISHKYNEVGTYTVILKVTTNEDESAETEKNIYVREIPLRACFTPSRRSGAAPLTVTFDSKCSTGAVSQYSWDFGDGETSESRKPTHTFEYAGTFNVTLEVTDDKNNVSSFSDAIVAEGEGE